VLVVDDERRSGKQLARVLARAGYRCTLTGTIEDAGAQLRSGSYDLIICDIGLRDESGQLLTPQLDATAALVIGELDDAMLAERAARLGADGYVVRPFSPHEVLIATVGALGRRRAGTGTTGEQLAEQEETVRRLCLAVEGEDPEAAPLLSRMSGYCWHIGRELELDLETCDLLRVASLMHDVGNVGVPREILHKPGSLRRAERAAMERHAELGYRILAGTRVRLLELASTIAWTHHERVDGSGYPRGLDGSAIPVEGRIAAVADVFAALTHDRVHRPRRSRAEAHELMREGRGTTFDPDVLDAFFAADERLAAGLPPASPGPRPAAAGKERGALSPRERQVLQLAADGHSALDIADALFLSPGTVKTHFQRIYAKLGARERAAAVATGLRRGLIE